MDQFFAQLVGKPKDEAVKMLKARYPKLKVWLVNTDECTIDILYVDVVRLDVDAAGMVVSVVPHEIRAYDSTKAN